MKEDEMLQGTFFFALELNGPYQSEFTSLSLRPPVVLQTPKVPLAAFGFSSMA